MLYDNFMRNKMKNLSKYKTATGYPCEFESAKKQELIDYRIYGNNGGVGDKTGNLIDYNTLRDSYTSAGITYIRTEDVITANGTLTTALSAFPIYSNSTIGWDKVEPNKNYYVYLDNVVNDGIRKFYVLISIKNTVTSAVRYSGSEQKYFTLSDDEIIILVDLRIYAPTGELYSVENEKFKIMIKEDDGSSEYEPYGYKIPVWNSGDSIIPKNLFNGENVINAYFSDIIKMTPNMRTVYYECKPSTTYVVSKIAGQRFTVGSTEEFPQENTPVLSSKSDSTASSIVYTTTANAKYLVAFVYNATMDTEIASDEMVASVQIKEEFLSKNIFPIAKEDNISIVHTGSAEWMQKYGRFSICVEPNTTYTLAVDSFKINDDVDLSDVANIVLYFFDSPTYEKVVATAALYIGHGTNPVGYVNYMPFNTGENEILYPVLSNNNAKLIRVSFSGMRICKGNFTADTMPPYQPYGINVGTLYLNSPLNENEYAEYKTQSIRKNNGENINTNLPSITAPQGEVKLTTNTIIPASKISVKYK